MDFPVVQSIVDQLSKESSDNLMDLNTALSFNDQNQGVPSVEKSIQFSDTDSGNQSFCLQFKVKEPQAHCYSIRSNL